MVNHIDGFGTLTKKTNILQTLRSYYIMLKDNEIERLRKKEQESYQTNDNLHYLLNRTRYDKSSQQVS